MNLRDLEYVCALADHGHFGRAAHACHVSQPTLSGQVRKLEAHLGVVLFERTNKSVRLTPIGREIVARARQALETAKEIEQTALAHRDPEGERLRIGLIPTIAPYLIPLLVRPLRARYPKLQTVLLEDVTDNLVQRLEAGDIEGAVIATQIDSSRLRSLPLYREPFWVALPNRHPLTRSRAVDPRDLEPKELLLLRDGHCLRDQALEICGVEETSTPADTTATSLETLVNLVGAGHGVTLVPALGLKSTSAVSADVVVRRFASADAVRDVRIAHRAGFPHVSLLKGIADVIRGVVPDAVKPLR